MRVMSIAAAVVLAAGAFLGTTSLADENSGAKRPLLQVADENSGAKRPLVVAAA